VPAYLIVDDFESYTNDSPNRVFQTWLDGAGFSADEFFPAGYSGNNTGALVGSDPATGNIMEFQNIHGGGQSAPMEYDNATVPYYSETVRTWDTAQDWTAAGVDTLVLYVKGIAGNDATQPLYVALENQGRTPAVVTLDPAVLTATDWTEQEIPLSRFAGLDARTVRKMYIGVGNRATPTQGGAGKLYIDDIRLTRP